MTAEAVDRPIFLVGMPRSGTTVVFEVFAARRDLAWFSQYQERYPAAPRLAALSRLADLTPALRRSVGRSDQARPWVEAIRVGPSEAYALWRHCCGEKFLYDYLLGVEATEPERRCLRSTVATVMRFHGKPRFAAKITGPARIGYLRSVFPDARFVHVVRDGRAVVQSLLRVYFWRDTRRLREPAWRNGLTRKDLELWEQNDRSPLALAAIQWARVTRSAREEAAALAPGDYTEVRYEDFVSTPEATLEQATSACGLAPDPSAAAFLAQRVRLRDMNFQWRERFTAGEIATIESLMEPTLRDFGYDPS